MGRKSPTIALEQNEQLGNVVKVYRAPPALVTQAKVNRYLIAPLLVLGGCFLAFFLGLMGSFAYGPLGAAACIPGLFLVFGGFYNARMSGQILRRTLTEWENGLGVNEGRSSSPRVFPWQELTAVCEDHVIVKFYRAFSLEWERTNSKYELRTNADRQMLDPEKTPGIAEAGERAAIHAARHLVSHEERQLEEGLIARFGEVGISRDVLELSGRQFSLGQIDQVKLEDLRMESRFTRVFKIIFFARLAIQGRADFYGPCISFLESHKRKPLLKLPVNEIPNIRALLEMLRRQSVRVQNNSSISFTLDPVPTSQTVELSPSPHNE